MKILIVDTSTSFLYVNFYDSDKNINFFSKSMATHNNHSENLLPAIESGLKENKLELNDFDMVIAGNGPGSYTGLRVGSVVSKMMAFTLNKELRKISSLFFIGSGYLNNDGLYAISSIAKKNYKYFCILESKKGKINIIHKDSFVSDEEYEKEISKYKDIVIVNEENYKIDSKVILDNSEKVNDIHNFIPDYLREANS